MNQFDKPFETAEDALAHYGVKGMKWGVRRDQYRAYQDRVYKESPGAVKTVVLTKNGDTLSIEKEKPGPLFLASLRLQKKEPPDALSAMVLRDKDGKKVGSFQVWREDKTAVRGEWLEIKKDSQGLGYSKAAIEGLIKASEKDSDITEIRLQVPSNAAAAKHIYSSIGFSKKSDYGDHPIYGNIEEWVRPVKKGVS